MKHSVNYNASRSIGCRPRGKCFRFAAAALLGLLVATPTIQATTITFSSFLVDDGNPGVGSPYDRLDASWSENLAFNQFNLPGQQLDSVKVSYSLFLEIAQTVKNTATRSSAPPSVSFSLNNKLDGGLSLGGNSLITFPGGSQLNNATVAKNTTHTFASFDLNGSDFVTLTGADILPFIGAGNVVLTSFANALTTPLITPPANFIISTLADGNASISVEYTYSAIPTVPDAGHSLPMLALSFAGMLCFRLRRPILT
jgi:hypothetical protein